jgi:hypothetical protein
VNLRCGPSSYAALAARCLAGAVTANPAIPSIHQHHHQRRSHHLQTCHCLLAIPLNARTSPRCLFGHRSSAVIAPEVSPSCSFSWLLRGLSAAWSVVLPVCNLDFATSNLQSTTHLCACNSVRLPTCAMAMNYVTFNQDYSCLAVGENSFRQLE